MPDSVLLKRARNGDQRAVAELYRSHVGAALTYARAIAPSDADAEDLVSESFARVIAQLAQDRGPNSSFRAYLFTTMRNRLYSTNRREYAVADVSLLDRPVQDRPSDDREDHELLRQAFDSLGPREQEVLLLLDVQELRPAEVCDRLGLRSSALSMRVARARSALAEAFLVAHVQPAHNEGCRVTRQQLGRHVRGKLSSLRARQVTAHLDGCDSCSTAVVEVSKVNRGRAPGSMGHRPSGRAGRPAGRAPDLSSVTVPTRTPTSTVPDNSPAPTPPTASTGAVTTPTPTPTASGSTTSPRCGPWVLYCWRISIFG